MPFVVRGGVKIWYDLVGSGTPLVLIQGLGYPSAASWRVIPDLAARHTVVLIDNRGVGLSDSPAGSFSIETMAADAAAVLDHAGIAAAHIAGFSMGGLIAQELALSRPDLALTLVLGCTSPGGEAAIPLSAEVAEQFTDWGEVPAEEAAWRSSVVCYADTTPRESIGADIEVRMEFPTDRRGYLHQVQAVATYGGARARLLKQWDRPTLVVHGDRDQIVPVANASVLRDAIPHAEVVLVEGAGHILMTDGTHALVDAMLDFMDRHRDVAPWVEPMAGITRRTG